MSEAAEQAVLIQWCQYKKIPIFAIPNGGSRHPLEAVNLKRQGVKPGVPDLFLPFSRNGKHGLFIEMKYGRNKPSEQQKEWLAYLDGAGYKTAVCYSFEEARRTIEDYVK